MWTKLNKKIYTYTFPWQLSKLISWWRPCDMVRTVRRTCVKIVLSISWCKELTACRCWLLKWTTHWLLNENYYSGFLFLCLLLLRFYLLVVSPLFSFQSMQHISGHAGLSHKRECLFKAQQETWITISLHSGSWEKLSSNHEEVKISPKYKTCKHTGWL